MISEEWRDRNQMQMVKNNGDIESFSAYIVVKLIRHTMELMGE